MSFTGTFTNGGVPKNPTFDTLVVRTALQLNAGAVFDLYNTADKTTNYEMLRADWGGNIAQILTQAGGSGTFRSLRIGTATAGGAAARYLEFAALGTSATSANFVTNLGASSGTQTAVAFRPVFNQSGTAGYIASDIDVTETATGSGTKLLQRWAVGGVAQGVVNNGGTFSVNGLAVSSTGFLGFLSSTSIGVAGFDVTLVRDAADTLALRRSTNAQTFRVYNTYTDASNYERGVFAWVSNDLTIGTEQAGTGAARAVNIRVGGTNRWAFNGSGHLIAYNDNSYDIGASGANRPRNIYVANAALSALFRCTSVPTVAGLPTAASAQAAMMFVSDSTVAAAGNFGAIVAGGGANIVPVYSDGTNWRIG
jgi:hypothetical protein